MPPKKILLAEDDADDRAIFYESLQQRSDIELMPFAENGEELMHTLDNTAHAASLPDLILLDQNMPRQNGLQTLQKIKQHQAYARIPVCIYSTYADENLKRQGIDAGAAKVFAKPYTAEGYQHLMNDMLNLFG